MTVMTRAQKKRHVEKCSNAILRLLPWKRHVSMKYVNMEDRFADISSEKEYFRAEIRFDLERHATKAEIEDTIMHEFMHMLVEPLENQARRLAKIADGSAVHKRNVKDSVEEVTSSIAETFRDLVFPKE